MRSKVLLPQPDGPSSAKNSPARMSSERFSTATTPPNRLLTDAMRSSGVLSPPDLSVAGASTEGNPSTIPLSRGHGSPFCRGHW